MTDLRMFSLYSGSSGNAFVISSSFGTVLIDAGKSAKQLCLALNDAAIAPESIGAILLTHEHNDHISALSVFLKKHPIPVHLPEGCVRKLSSDPAVAPHLVSHPPKYTEEICGMRVTSFPTPHDSRASVGYRIEIPSKNGVLTLGYATDIGFVSRDVEEALLGCDWVVLESNHDPEMLKNGPYPYELKRRIASGRGHLSNGECALLAARLCNAGTKSLMLAHLSAENNEPALAYDECFSAIADRRVSITVAQPNLVTQMPLWEESSL
ncbi:MAG: MBL fold metallo-hydrolase [Ruminococcaceae bacterium]|nr:MBL fold metallo-hydrolase [Oscillospiraceae bacterium]